ELWFSVNIVERSGCASYPPVNRIDQYNFVHMVLGEGMYIMGVIDDYANVITCLEFMKSLKNLIITSIGGVSEANINKKRISLVELLEESCIFGIPQVTDMSVLGSWVKESFSKKNTKNASNLSITNQITGQITWRKPGIVHQEKTFYLTVNEKVSVVVSPTGQPLATSIDGVVTMKSYLSGMPECRCTLNGKIFGVTRVKPANQNNASYRSSQDIHIPFILVPLIRGLDSSNSIEIRLVLKSDFKPQISALNIEVIIPVPSNTAKTYIRHLKGSSRHRKSDNTIVWKIPKMYGCKELTFHAQIDLFVSGTNTKFKNEPRLPITMKFQIPITCSGVSVRYLKVFEPKLNYSDKDVEKWVRYISTEGQYEFRT
ncbi:hypothetical protein MXB_3996, partial [Myxobolus squamalis]